MLWSHKVTRWLVPWAAVVGGAATVGLASSHHWLWWVVGLVASATIVATVVGGWPAGRHTPALLAVPAYGFFGVVAGLHDWIGAMRGNLAPTWEPRRPAPHFRTAYSRPTAAA